MRSGVLVMEPRRSYMMINGYIGILSLSIFLLLFTTQSEARISKQQMKAFEDIKRTKGSIISKNTNGLRQYKHLGVDTPLDLPNAQSYGVSSPFSLPPFDSLAPTSLPENTPPFCEYPPSTPLPPSTTVPAPVIYSPPSFTPIFPIPNPPENSPEYVPTPPTYTPGTPPEYNVPSPITYIPGPPEYQLSPPIYFPSPFGNIPSPSGSTPSPYGYVPSPSGSTPSPYGYIPSPSGSTPSPYGYVPSPSGSIPSPSGYVPSPYGFAPSPPVFQPPVVFPPPSVPPSPFKGPQRALWCVAKPSVPDPIIQEAMNYACGSGADCGSIQPDGSCYHPETLFAHASFAFNSFWQRTKAVGGTCDFGGTAILVTVDPSFDGCQFIAT